MRFRGDPPLDGDQCKSAHPRHAEAKAESTHVKLQMNQNPETLLPDTLLPLADKVAPRVSLLKSQGLT